MAEFDPKSVDEMMSLNPEYGRVPEALRNKGYEKLDFGPGEGGVRQAPAKPEATDMDQFLAAVEAGADPQKLAATLRSGATVSRRRGAR